jgi:hypothetical protein
VADRLRLEYENHLAFVRARAEGDEEHPALRKEQEYRTLRLALVASKRATLVRLRDERRIDDTVLRQLVTRLDTEEVGLAPPSAMIMDWGEGEACAVPAPYRPRCRGHPRRHTVGCSSVLRHSAR